MSDDPFARFERSRGGILVPVALFLLGAIPTTIALMSLHQTAVAVSAQAETAPDAAAAAGDRNDGEPAPPVLPRPENQEPAKP